MKPYGREKKIKGGKAWKIDNHPKKGLINWWESICEPLTRSKMKQNWRNSIKIELSQKQTNESNLPEPE